MDALDGDARAFVVNAPRRVALVGPESTGKSTLAARLAAHYRTSVAPEFLREYVERRLPGLAPGEPLVREADQRAIVDGQLAGEEAAARLARGVLFCDTDPLQTAVYAEHYFGRCPAWLRALVAARRYDLTLLLDVDVAFVPDPLRDRPLQRAELHGAFAKALEAAGRPTVAIGGDWAEREARARAAVDALLAA